MRCSGKERFFQSLTNHMKLHKIINKTLENIFEETGFMKN